MSPPDINSEIMKHKSRVFRRISVKRKSSSTGLFESTWQDISKDVERWGTIDRAIDNIRYSRLNFSDTMVRVANDSGKYNPNTDSSSLWSGYGDLQRSLVKIECGFLHQTQGASGIWTNTEYPTDATALIGIISGDATISDQNSVVLPVKPLMQVFRDYPARLLVGYTTVGMTAERFMTMLRDQTDGSGSYVFRPFFGDTTSYWSITATTNTYSNMNTSTAADVINADCWEVIESLAEAEDMIAYISRTGTFKFQSRGANTTGAQYYFFGRQFVNTNYGHTIKRIDGYGTKLSDYYSRVQLKFIDSEIYTSYESTQTSLVVTGGNNPWNLGHRSFEFENFWVQVTASALVVVQSVFAAVSALSSRVDFTTSLIPHLDILDRVEISYDSAGKGVFSRWDNADWADSSTPSTDLVWEAASGDAIRLQDTPFKLLSVSIDLDNLESRFIGTQL